MASGQPNDIRIILCTIAYRDRLLEHVLDVAVELDFDGVEIWGREPHISEQFDENRIQAVHRMLQQRDLVVPVLGSYLRFGSTNPRTEDNIELEDTLYIARCLGTPLLRVWASDISSENATQAVWETTVGELQQACDQAQKLGIVFAVEMQHGTLADTGPAAKHLVELIGRENFRINFQVASNTEPQTPLERLQTVLPYVVHMHAQNYASLPSEGQPRRVPLSDGAIDYTPLINQLHEANYNGCIALEFSWMEGEGKREALAADLSYLRRLVNK